MGIYLFRAVMLAGIEKVIRKRRHFSNQRNFSQFCKAMARVKNVSMANPRQISTERIVKAPKVSDVPELLYGLLKCFFL